MRAAHAARRGQAPTRGAPDPAGDPATAPRSRRRTAPSRSHSATAVVGARPCSASRSALPKASRALVDAEPREHFRSSRWRGGEADGGDGESSPGGIVSTRKAVDRRWTDEIVEPGRRQEARCTAAPRGRLVASSASPPACHFPMPARDGVLARSRAARPGTNDARANADTAAVQVGRPRTGFRLPKDPEPPWSPGPSSAYDLRPDPASQASLPPIDDHTDQPKQIAGIQILPIARQTRYPKFSAYCSNRDISLSRSRNAPRSKRYRSPRSQ